MTERDISAIWKAMGVASCLREITQFHAEEDGRPYQVWKLRTDSEDFVLKEITVEEREIYETFLLDCAYAPQGVRYFPIRGQALSADGVFLWRNNE